MSGQTFAEQLQDAFQKTSQAEEKAIIAAALQAHRMEGMKVLIAIVSCERDKASHELIRQTWAKNIPVDYRFFMGRNPKYCNAPMGDDIYCQNDAGLCSGGTSHQYTGNWETDVVRLDVPDDWDGLPRKTQAICRWAAERDYDFIFKCDTDSYVHVPRLLESGFEKYHYSGCCGENENVYPDSCFPANGGGYWLSRRSFEYLAENMNLGLGKNCEDWCVFLSLMKGAGIFVHHDPRYMANRGTPGLAPAAENDFIILHDSGDNSLRIPDRMMAAHESAYRN